MKTAQEKKLEKEEAKAKKAEEAKAKKAEVDKKKAEDAKAKKAEAGKAKVDKEKSGKAETDDGEDGGADEGEDEPTPGGPDAAETTPGEEEAAREGHGKATGRPATRSSSPKKQPEAKAPKASPAAAPSSPGDPGPERSLFAVSKTEADPAQTEDDDDMVGCKEVGVTQEERLAALDLENQRVIVGIINANLTFEDGDKQQEWKFKAKSSTALTPTLRRICAVYSACGQLTDTQVYGFL